MQLKPASQSDIPAMWALRSNAVRISCATHYRADEISAWSATPAPASYAALIAAGGALLAMQGAGLAGYAMLDSAGAEVDAVFVDPAKGGQGIGGALLRGLEQLAAEKQLDRLHLYAALNAVPFYLHAGYIALRDEQYAHPSGILLNCLYMEKQLA
ncbi:acetyltransferase family protein [Janthinobacterium agaricidamnosum NBRC 102515 = DSM 9628]|uniref:Acetyltransferase family protein n=2 Tax=Janthinobacterium agaricidamnosum TaxID=55508 RepID=W0V8D0_9BURK|nr:GNAT family N-acetyltransferase [Janthinobacterium agaricidamnosum]CDG83512.1 acetyltransferase family protein [Janthinobacterium agaricidamnosum NBRC 102515 = DSM 9628]